MTLHDILAFFGLVTASPPVPASHELAVWVPLALTTEEITNAPPAPPTFAIQSTTRSLAKLGARINFKQKGTTFKYDMLTLLQKENLLRPDPADNTLFQVKLQLHIVYPSTSGTPDAIDAKSPLPLVLLNHGNHNHWEPRPPVTQTGPTTLLPATIRPHPSYQGYQYLQEALALNNIVSVSVDHNFACLVDSLIETRADTIIAALNTLSDQAADATSRYHNLLDFTKIGLMGHSRGGDAVVRAAQKIAADPVLGPKFSIKTVCSLAPTDFTGTDPAHRLTLGANDLQFYLMVYGALDGDIKGAGGAGSFVGTGFRHYDRASCPKSMVFIDKCCHDYFNTLWAAEPAEEGLGDPRVLAKATHQSIAVDYLGDLFQWQLGGANLPQRFDGRSPNRAGEHVSLQWKFGTTLKPLDDFQDTTNNLLGVARVLKNPGVPVPPAVADMASITIGGVTLSPHTPHQTQVLHVDLSGAAPAGTSILEEPVPAAHQDWSTFDTLIFSLAGWFDPTSTATIAAANLPRLKITLKDSAAGSFGVDWTGYGSTLPSRPVFKTLPSSGNITLMRLETIPIALSAFTGVDMTKIATLALDIQPTNGTHVFVDSIHVIKR